MFRYRLLASYDEKLTEARVAQVVVVIAGNDHEAVEMAKAKLAQNALGGHVQSIKAVEKQAVAPGVVFVGDPYIPLSWPSVQTLAARAMPLVGRH